jgi:hypothetical protein
VISGEFVKLGCGISARDGERRWGSFCLLSSAFNIGWLSDRWIVPVTETSGLYGVKSGRISKIVIPTSPPTLTIAYHSCDIHKFGDIYLCDFENSNAALLNKMGLLHVLAGSSRIGSRN